ncbi:MAG: alpha/beta hydrolase [Firmicutes bacterium]|nr:alpha/beta hydrolase [Bacillota bacterium]
MELVYPAEKVFYYADGQRIAALLWAPQGGEEGRRYPAVIVARGFGANKEFVTPGFARDLNQAGYVVLGFDYRGVGESGGETGRLIPMEHCEDIRCAVTYLQTRPEVDVGRIGLFGDSIGASYVVWVAGMDDRVKCTISVGGAGDCRRWTKLVWGYEKYMKLVELVKEDRKQRVLTGKSGCIPVNQYLAWGEQETKDWAEIVKVFGTRPRSVGGPITIETVEKFLEFVPEEQAHRIRALMVSSAAVSVVVPPEESIAIYEKAREPKRLWIQEPRVTPTRYGSHLGQEGYPDYITQEYLSWLDQHLKDA